MTEKLKHLTAEIVSSYVEANKIAAADLSALIEATFAALRAAEQAATEEPAVVARPTAAQIRKSITPEALISFVDGKPYRMLKRHLSTNGLTPADYRARFGLPQDYPLTAPSYSAQRSALARNMGLGRKTETEAVAPPAPKAGPITRTKILRAEKAGPGARVPKATRSPRARKPAEEDT